MNTKSNNNQLPSLFPKEVLDEMLIESETVLLEDKRIPLDEFYKITPSKLDKTRSDLFKKSINEYLINRTKPQELRQNKVYSTHLVNSIAEYVNKKPMEISVGDAKKLFLAVEKITEQTDFFDRERFKRVNGLSRLGEKPLEILKNYFSEKK